MTTQEENQPATTSSGPLSIEEWVVREVAKAPDLTEDQSRHLSRIHGFGYDGPDPPEGDAERHAQTTNRPTLVRLRVGRFVVSGRLSGGEGVHVRAMRTTRGHLRA